MSIEVVAIAYLRRDIGKSHILNINRRIGLIVRTLHRYTHQIQTDIYFGHAYGRRIETYECSTVQRTNSGL